MVFLLMESEFDCFDGKTGLMMETEKNFLRAFSFPESFCHGFH